MNIFKILSSGDGRLKEPNLSAFLAYLLNPKADHGLGSSFLQKVLKPFIEESNLKPEPAKDWILKDLWSDIEGDENAKKEDKYILDLSINSRFNVDVVLEKAFLNVSETDIPDEKNKEIVDIVLKISGHKKPEKEDISYLFENDQPIAFIIIENKINTCDDIQLQLEGQYKYAKGDLPNRMSNDEWLKWKDNICTILISTGDQKMCDYFKNFKGSEKGNKKSIHLSWNSNLTTNSIKGIILELLQESEKGIIAPIHSYTAETLKSLINFIENDFSSDADDQQQGGQKSVGIHYDTLDELWNSGTCRLNDQIQFEKIKGIFNNIEHRDQYDMPKPTKTHLLTFNKNKRKICSLTPRSKTEVALLVPKDLLNIEVRNYLESKEFQIKTMHSDGGMEYITSDKTGAEIIEVTEYLYNHSL